MNSELVRFLEEAERINAYALPASCVWLDWWAFHLEHRVIYEDLRALAFRAKTAHFSKYGIKSLWEVLRWHRVIERTEQFKCRNAYHSRYARYLMWREPELEGFFDIAGLRTL